MTEILKNVPRRFFLKGLAAASVVATFWETQTAMGAVAGTNWPANGKARPNSSPDIQTALSLTALERTLVSKVIDGIVPPQLPVRKLLAEKDPQYDPVQNFEDFLRRQGPVYFAQVQTLLNLVNRLPTFQVFGLKPAIPVSEISDVSQLTDLFLQLRDHNLLRDIFRALRGMGSQPIYTNEKVVWSAIDYPLPWIDGIDNLPEEVDPNYSLDLEMRRRLQTLTKAVVAHDKIKTQLSAAQVVKSESDKLVLETDIVIIGTGTSAGVAAREITQNSNQRVLILERGSFHHPKTFNQREQYMVPKVYMDNGALITSTDVFGYAIPKANAALIRGSLVGGSGTINHAMAFSLPQPVLEEWNEKHGVEFTSSQIRTHEAVLRREMHIARVPDETVNLNNRNLGLGATKLGYKNHRVADRNSKECLGCGYCDMGCRYNRKQTPILAHLPLAAEKGAQLIADCEVERLEFAEASRVEGRDLEVKSVHANLLDPLTGGVTKHLEVRCKKVVLAAGSIASSRILIKSGLLLHRAKKGLAPAVGGRFSCHAPCTIYGEMSEPVYPTAGGSPQSYSFEDFGPESLKGGEYNAFIWEGIANHPMTFSNVMPFESPEGHWGYMSKFNFMNTICLIFRDRPVGEVGEFSLKYQLAKDDRRAYAHALRIGAELLFAAGAKNVVLPNLTPLILKSTADLKLVDESVIARGDFLITSAHPMGGNPMGDDPRVDVVDPIGQSWDVGGLWVADGSILPTSLGVNPNLSIATLARAITHEFIKQI